MSSEALRLFKQLNLQLEQEGRFQPREKGLSLIESAAEVRRGSGGGVRGAREAVPAGQGETSELGGFGWGELSLFSPRGSGLLF